MPDYFPQPRPVLYLNTEEEVRAETETKPVRTGPPRYPPAPPLAGDAPDPDRQPNRGRVEMLSYHPDRAATLFTAAYVLATAYTLFQLLWNLLVSGGTRAALTPLLVEFGLGMVVTAWLLMLEGTEYVPILGLVGLHAGVGLALAQWQSPGLWVAVALLIYLERPSMWGRPFGVGARVTTRDVVHSRWQPPRGSHHHQPRPSRSRPDPPTWAQRG
jgi:hypothetical protein